MTKVPHPRLRESFGVVLGSCYHVCQYSSLMKAEANTRAFDKKHAGSRECEPSIGGDFCFIQFHAGGWANLLAPSFRCKSKVLELVRIHETLLIHHPSSSTIIPSNFSVFSCSQHFPTSHPKLPAPVTACQASEALRTPPGRSHRSLGSEGERRTKGSPSWAC